MSLEEIAPKFIMEIIVSLIGLSITLILRHVSGKLDELTKSINELNLKVGENNIITENLTKICEDHESRLRVIETKEVLHGKRIKRIRKGA